MKIGEVGDIGYVPDIDLGPPPDPLRFLDSYRCDHPSCGKRLQITDDQCPQQYGWVFVEPDEWFCEEHGDDK